MPSYKDFKSDITADDSGQISGYFSTYDREPDAYGDIIAPGAFADTIKAREESGHPFPLCWNHDLDQIIGVVDSIEDTEKGPHMVASFFDTELAQEKREIVKSGCVFQFSFAYDVLDAAPVTIEDGTKANELRKLDLFEVSIVPIPANQHAVMTEIKAETADIKAGRRNSAADAQTIQDAIDLLQSLIAAVDGEVDEEEAKDSSEVNAKAEEPSENNAKAQKLLELIDLIEREDS